MGTPTSLLQQARAFARDFPRDSMPKGYLWDVVDYVPAIIDAGLTGRGGWLWGSDAGSANDYESGILATFTGGDQLLAQNTIGNVGRIDITNPAFPMTPVGTTTRCLQNPVQLLQDVIAPDASGGAPPALWRAGGLTVMNAAHKHSRYATVYKGMAVTGNAPGEEHVIRFTVPKQDLTATASFDDRSQYPTSQTVTGLAALRSAVLIFHTGSVERMRGTTPAHSTTSGDGDLFLEPLFDRVGCKDPRTIAYWNDNCIFADEHGVHVTDGAVIRNLVSQGAILYYWRTIWGSKISAAGCTFLDYYIITIRRSAGATPITLICDLNRRQWFRFSNINSLTFIAAGGSTGMERLWGSQAGTHRLILVSPCFFPAFTTSLIQDADGTAVLPTIETPWYRLSQEGRKRVRFAYVSYDIRTGAPTLADSVPSAWREFDELDEPPPVLLEPMVVSNVLDVGYIRSPQQTAYVDLGVLPSTSEYSRYRLPVGQFPYGVAFKLAQTQGSTVTRLFDIAVEAGAAERSRV